MKNISADQCYNEYTPTMEKASHPLVTVNWSALGDVVMSTLTILLMVAAVGVY